MGGPTIILRRLKTNRNKKIFSRQATIFFIFKIIYEPSVFWPRVRCVHPSFSADCHTKQGAARPPPPIAASLLMYNSAPKNKLNLSNLGRPNSALFSFHGTTEAMNYEVPCPCRTHRSFADPFGNIWGQTVLVLPYALTFFDFSFFVQLLDLFFLLFSSFSSLLFNFFFFISSYPSLLTSAYSSHRYPTMLRLLILLFLYFKLFVVL